MRQVEVSRTIVFDDPRRARHFFEALVKDNVDIGRPETVSMVFARRPPRPRRSHSDNVRMDFSYKHSRVKQYLKEGKAYRIETVVNKPADLGLRSRICCDLPELVARARGSTTACLRSSVPVRAVPSALCSLSASTRPTTERAAEP